MKASWAKNSLTVIVLRSIQGMIKYHLKLKWGGGAVL